MIGLVVFLVAVCLPTAISAAVTARKRDDQRSDAEIAEHEAWMEAMRAVR